MKQKQALSTKCILGCDLMLQASMWDETVSGTSFVHS